MNMWKWTSGHSLSRLGCGRLLAVAGVALGLLISPVVTHAQEILLNTNAIDITCAQWTGPTGTNNVFSVTVTSNNVNQAQPIWFLSDHTCSWLTLTPSNGSSYGLAVPFFVNYMSANLSVGIYTCAVVAVSALTTNRMVTNTVTLTITNNPNITQGVRSGPTNVMLMIASPTYVTIPILLESTGDVHAVGFSFAYNKSYFSSPTVTVVDVSSTMVSNYSEMSSYGRVGLNFIRQTTNAMPPDGGLTFNGTYASGVVTLASVTLKVSSNAYPTIYPFTLGDSPVPRQMVNALGYQLSVQSTRWPTGGVNVIAGQEADVIVSTNYPEWKVTVSDWVKIGRYAAKLDTIGSGPGFQRADCAPGDILGDGYISIADWVQCGLYMFGGLAISTNANGPCTAYTNTIPSPISFRANRGASPSRQPGAMTTTRTIAAKSIHLPAGATDAMAIQMTSLGNENALAFSLSFDASRLSYQGLRTIGQAQSATLIVNAQQAADGHVGMAIGLPLNQAFTAGTQTLFEVLFNNRDSDSGQTVVSFDDDPAIREVCGVMANGLPVTFVDATLSLGNVVDPTPTSTPVPGAPVVPTGVAASDGTYSDKVHVTWLSASGAIGYKVYRASVNASSAAQLVGTVTACFYDDVSAAVDAVYYYWVKALTSTGESVMSVNDSGWRRSETATSSGPGTAAIRGGDYDGDGLADLAVYSEATGAWNVRLSGSDYASVSTTLGGPGYTMAPDDYDGDGKLDPAVYQESTGSWQILMSANRYVLFTAVLGGPGYVPGPADFDGDHKADLAVYQDVTGTLKALLSASHYAVVSAFIGGAGCKAVSEDYDGDSKADPTVYREADGMWQIMVSGSAYQSSMLTLGGKGYEAVPADYDGDGKADPAVYRQADGNWQVRLSANGYALVTVTFGGANYRASVADYDGDGKADPVIYLDPAIDPTAANVPISWSALLSGHNYSAVATP